MLTTELFIYFPILTYLFPIDKHTFSLYSCINTLIQLFKQEGGNDMAWEMDNARPIYLQLMERIQLEIITGTYLPGDKLPAVRELAMTAAVNPNTMQKALTELEKLGLVYAKRTSGRFITEDAALLENMKKELATKHIDEFLTNMKQLGFEQIDAIHLLTTYQKEV